VLAVLVISLHSCESPPEQRTGRNRDLGMANESRSRRAVNTTVAIESNNVAAFMVYGRPNLTQHRVLASFPLSVDGSCSKDSNCAFFVSRPKQTGNLAKSVPPSVSPLCALQRCCPFLVDRLGERSINVAMIRLRLFFLLSLVATTGFGCRNFNLAPPHGPFPQVSSRREGVLNVASFKDTRQVSNKASLGDFKGGVGNRLGDFVVKDGRPLESVVQGFFEDALAYVGYSNSSSVAKVQVEGEVFEFLMTSGWEFTTKIGVLTRVRDFETKRVLWEKEIRSEEDDMMSGNNAAKAAFDVLLANAIKEFSSLDFFEAVERKNRRALE